MPTEKITSASVLTVLGLIVGYIESVFFVIPVYGIKIGLSNIVVIYAVVRLGKTEAYFIGIMKCVLSAVLFSGVFSLVYSLGSIIVSVFVMNVCKNDLLGNYVSVIGMSMLSSVCFNICQFITAAAVLSSISVLYHLWYVIPVSLFTGALTGIVIYKILEYKKV